MKNLKEQVQEYILIINEKLLDKKSYSYEEYNHYKKLFIKQVLELDNLSFLDLGVGSNLDFLNNVIDNRHKLKAKTTEYIVTYNNKIKHLDSKHITDLDKIKQLEENRNVNIKTVGDIGNIDYLGTCNFESVNIMNMSKFWYSLDNGKQAIKKIDKILSDYSFLNIQFSVDLGIGYKLDLIEELKQFFILYPEEVNLLLSGLSVILLKKQIQ